MATTLLGIYAEYKTVLSVCVFLCLCVSLFCVFLCSVDQDQRAAQFSQFPCLTDDGVESNAHFLLLLLSPVAGPTNEHFVLVPFEGWLSLILLSSNFCMHLSAVPFVVDCDVL